MWERLLLGALKALLPIVGEYVWETVKMLMERRVEQYPDFTPMIVELVRVSDSPDLGLNSELEKKVWVAKIAKDAMTNLGMAFTNCELHTVIDMVYMKHQRDKLVAHG